MKKDKLNKAEEPAVTYEKSPKKTITFFNSFEEMEAHNYQYLASLSYEQRIRNLEKLRKQIFHKSLLPNGEWPLLKRTFTITKLSWNVCHV